MTPSAAALVAQRASSCARVPPSSPRRALDGARGAGRASCSLAAAPEPLTATVNDSFTGSCSPPAHGHCGDNRVLRRTPPPTLNQGRPVAKRAAAAALRQVLPASVGGWQSWDMSDEEAKLWSTHKRWVAC